MMIVDYSKIPDILAISALTGAFASIQRRSRRLLSADASGSLRWLTAWVLIVIHFIAFMFVESSGLTGMLAGQVGLVSLAVAAIFFMWATIPYRNERSSCIMVVVMILTNAAVLVLDTMPHPPTRLFDLCAVLVGFAPLLVTLVFSRLGVPRMRLIGVALMLLLGAMILVIRHTSLGLHWAPTDAVLFMLYMGSCIHFWYMHRRATAGSIISILGFLAWANVFTVAPLLAMIAPKLQIESEVWNLPKYVVAVGMLLVLLESQIERTEYLALHDDLTKVANRRLLQDRLANAMERARRHGSSMGLLQIDLDKFKLVNDSFGHHIGDLLLHEVARRLEFRVRRSDTLARTGGDEFAVVLEEPVQPEEAHALAQVLSQIVQQPFLLEGHRIEVGASIGVAIFPEDGETLEELCIHADEKMYNQKDQKTQIAAD